MAIRLRKNNITHSNNICMYVFLTDSKTRIENGTYSQCIVFCVVLHTNDISNKCFPECDETDLLKNFTRYANSWIKSNNLQCMHSVGNVEACLQFCANLKTARTCDTGLPSHGRFQCCAQEVVWLDVPQDKRMQSELDQYQRHCQ